MLHLSYSSGPVMKLDYQLLLKSFPLTLLAGSAPATTVGTYAPRQQVHCTFAKRHCLWPFQDIRHEKYCVTSAAFLI